MYLKNRRQTTTTRSGGNSYQEYIDGGKIERMYHRVNLLVRMIRLLMTEKISCSVALELTKTCTQGRVLRVYVLGKEDAVKSVSAG